MPTGKVKDEGDPGGMNGQRIGILKEINDNGHEIGKSRYFNNGPLGSAYYSEEELVDFEKKKSKKGLRFAIVKGPAEKKLMN